MDGTSVMAVSDVFLRALSVQSSAFLVMTLSCGHWTGRG